MAIDPLCDLMRVLEHPARREILLHLAGHPMTASALQHWLGADSGALAGHIRELEASDIVASSQGARSPVYQLCDRVAVAFASGLAEVRLTATDGSVLSFVTAAPTEPQTRGVAGQEVD